MFRGIACLGGMVLIAGIARGQTCGDAAEGECVIPQSESAMAACGLSVQASDAVLLPGESSQVDVSAQLPDTDAHAFAWASFDIFADLPSWESVSDGVIAGARVLGAEAGQIHNPFAGDYADPANPLRTWTSVYAPDSYEPQLVQIEASPNEIWYYPSELTSTSAPCAGTPGRQWIMVNPLIVGNSMIAPGPGSEIQRSGSKMPSGGAIDVLIGNTGGDRDEVDFGLIVPPGQRTRLKPEKEPTLVIMETEAVEVQRSRITSLQVTFSGTVNPGVYDVAAHWPGADAFEYVIHLAPTRTKTDISAFAGQTVRIRIQAANNSSTPLTFNAFPQSFQGGVRVAVGDLDSGIYSRFNFDRPTKVVAPDGQAYTADAVEVHAVSNNLKQLSIGVHAVHSRHSGGILVGLGDGSVRNVRASIGG